VPKTPGEAAMRAVAPFTGGASLEGLTEAGGRLLDVVKGKDLPPEKPSAPVPYNDYEEHESAKRQAQDIYDKNLLSHDDSNTPIKPAIRREDHPLAADLKRAGDIIESLPNVTKQDQARRKTYEAQYNRMAARIDRDTKAAEDQAKKARQEELKALNSNYENVPARDKTAEVMKTHVDNYKTDLQNKVDANDQQAAFSLRISPLTTMGTERKDKEGNKVMDYTPLRDASARIALLNKDISNEAAVKYAVAIGSYAGGTDEKGNHVPGRNGRYGSGATNYTVLGKDESGMYKIKMADGRTLRVDKYTMDQFDNARIRGAQEAAAWEKEQREKARPTIGGRILRAVIPPKGF
jgi:hypothetical protein